MRTSIVSGVLAVPGTSFSVTDVDGVAQIRNPRCFTASAGSSTGRVVKAKSRPTMRTNWRN
jgi:hypothetical protein